MKTLPQERTRDLVAISALHSTIGTKFLVLSYGNASWHCYDEAKTLIRR